MSIAADYEFFSRPEWAGLQKAYGLSFRAQRQMQPDFMYAAVASGEVDVIAGYTSDGLIAKYDLVVLDDPKHAIPPYDAIVLLAPKRAGDQALRAALQPLLGKIDIATMREANLRAAGNDADEFARCGGAMAVGEDREAIVGSAVIARSKATEQSILSFHGRWIASRSLSSGARSRDPVARNDVDSLGSTRSHAIDDFQPIKRLHFR